MNIRPHRRLWHVRPLMISSVMAFVLGAFASFGGSSADASTATAHTDALTSATGCVKGTAPGITSSTVTVAATVVDLSGGSLSNATVGVPPAALQEHYWTLVANSINKAGGAGCRKILLKFYDVNPIDAAGAQQTCLTIAKARPFMVLDVGALSAVNASNCIPMAKVAFASQYLTPDQLAKYYPYYLSIRDIPTNNLRNGILGFKQLGYFSPAKGFKKLGVLYSTCNPTLIVAERAALKQAGVPTSKVLEFNLGCPAGGSFTPASLEQAALAFKNGGVSDVTSAYANNAAAAFTQVAAQQKYKPRYLLTTDQAAVPNQSGADAPNPANLNGGINVATDAWGEATTPGFTPSGGTKKCNTIFTAPGQPPVYKQLDGFGGEACDYLWLVQGILNNAKSVKPASIPTALHAIGSIDFSYPDGPVNYGAAPKGAPYGLGYWRPEHYLASCKCWQIPNPQWNQPFT